MSLLSRRRFFAIALSVLTLLAPASAQTPSPRPASPALTFEAMTRLDIRETSGTLFENVVAVLRARYVDAEFRANVLPALAEQYRARAQAAATLPEQRQVVHEFLSHIPASHLGVLSRYAHRTLMADLAQAPYPSFGFQAIGAGPDLYAGMILQGGPAARAGLLLGDRLVTIDGVAARQSPRLDWRTDDAFIGDERDPSVQYLIASASDVMELRVERRRGEFLTVTIPAEEYTPFDAAEASVRIIRSGRSGARSVGYLQFWYVHMTGVPALITRAIEGRLKDVDALVLDLRGRGGSAGEVARIVEVVEGYRKRTGRPVVALADRQSRSGKDVLLYEFRQRGIRIVGEASAGAVIPASFADVGHDSVLMFPSIRLPRYSDLLELKPIPPDVAVTRAGLFAAGRDPILESGVAEALRLAPGRPLPSFP
jgi:carboxyl-terminal processing protease